MHRRELLLPPMAAVLALLFPISCSSLQGLFATPTPTPTRTPTPTSTHTPTPTNTPTVTPTPRPDISGAVLTDQDFPPGFEEMSPDELGLTREDLSGDDFKVESFFAFLEAEHFQIVMGSTTLLLTRLDQAGFDVFLSQPESLTNSVVQGMGATEILEQGELAHLDDIADASAGLTVVAGVQGIPMRMDIAVFRRDIVGAYVVVMYLDGDVPEVSVEEVAMKLDDRIVEVLPSDD